MIEMEIKMEMLFHLHVSSCHQPVQCIRGPRSFHLQLNRASHKTEHVSCDVM